MGEARQSRQRRPRYTAQTSERTGPRNLQRSRTRCRGYDAPRVRQKVQVGTGRRALSPDLHRLPPSPSLFREDVVLRSVERPTPVPLAPRGTADRPRECREGAVERRLLAVEALEIRDRESRGRPAAPSAAVAYASSACQATASMMGCQFFSHLIPISLASSGLGCGCVTSLCKRPPHYLRSSAPLHPNKIVIHCVLVVERHRNALDFCRATERQFRKAQKSDTVGRSSSMQVVHSAR